MNSLIEILRVYGEKSDKYMAELMRLQVLISKTVHYLEEANPKWAVCTHEFTKDESLVLRKCLKCDAQAGAIDILMLCSERAEA